MYLLNKQGIFIRKLFWQKYRYAMVRRSHTIFSVGFTFSTLQFIIEFKLLKSGTLTRYCIFILPLF